MEVLNTGSQLIDFYKPILLISLYSAIFSFSYLFRGYEILKRNKNKKPILIAFVIFLFAICGIFYTIQDSHYYGWQEVFLTDITEQELKEDYNVLEVRGKIYKICEKGAND